MRQRRPWAPPVWTGRRGRAVARSVPVRSTVAAPTASLARPFHVLREDVRARVRGVGIDFNGERLPGCHPGAAFGPFLSGRNHDP